MYPKISVIIPVYNVEKYLNKCLDSVVNQTLQDIEIICVDDCSTDCSLKILEEYAKNDSRIVIIKQIVNQGQGVARNRALEIAQGKYIAFLDGDDWLDKDAFKCVYEVFEKTSVDVIHFNYTIFSEASKSYYPKNFARETLDKYKYNLTKNPYYNINLLRNNCFTQLNLYSGIRMYSKNFLDKFSIKFAPTKNGEDQLFVNAVLLNANNIYYLDRNFYYYRVRENSTVRVKNNENFCIFESVNMFENYLKENNFFWDYKNEFIQYKIQVYAWCYSQIPDSEKEDYFSIVKGNLDKKSYEKFLEKIGLKISLIHNIFSVKNEYSGCYKYKVFRVLFLKWRLKWSY